MTAVLSWAALVAVLWCTTGLVLAFLVGPLLHHRDSRDSYPYLDGGSR